MQKRLYPISQDAGNACNSETVHQTAIETASLIIIGKSETLQLSVLEDMSENEELDWTSSDETIAAVDSAGLVTPYEIGETLITAKSKDGEYIESIYVVVEDAPTPQYCNGQAFL